MYMCVCACAVVVCVTSVSLGKTVTDAVCGGVCVRVCEVWSPSWMCVQCDHSELCVM